MGVDVEPAVAREPEQSNASILREVDRQARGRRDGADQADTCQPGLLNDLERRAPAHGQRVRGDRQPIVEQHRADHLVHGVMAADVFGRRFADALGREQPGRVEPACAVEYSLADAQTCRVAPAATPVDIVQVTGNGDARVLSESIVRRPQRPQEELVSTLRRSARSVSSDDLARPEQIDVDDVVPVGMVRVPAVLDGADVICGPHDAFREQEPGGERAIRRPASA